MSAGDSASAALGFRTVTETRAATDFPFYVHAMWQDEFPWLAQGITGRSADDAYDMTLFGDTASGVIQQRWAALRSALGVDYAVHARQVHGARVLEHRPPGFGGLSVGDAADGHVALEAGVLLAVSIADCVPVHLVAPWRRIVALLHAGWRGVAAGILENGVAALRAARAGEPADLLLHLGPAICGACYEVGPEVHRALGLPEPSAAGPVDLRGILARRAEALGVRADAITVSSHCTRCGDASFHSHRAGSAARQIAVLGVRAATHS